MYVEIKDLDIMEVSSQDEITDGTKTYIPTESFIERENTKFTIELEKKCAEIGQERCFCDPIEISAITGKPNLREPEEQANKYSYHALVESQGDVYADTKCLIRHCKKCGKNTLYGNPMMILMGMSQFYNVMLNFEETEIKEDDETSDEVIDTEVSDIPEDIEETPIEEGNADVNEG